MKHEDQTIALQAFLKKLNAEPDPKDLQKTPDGKAGYLPISFVETTLDEIFLGQWSTENFRWSAIMNEVQGSIDLTVTNPVTGQTLKRTGAASIVIMVDSLSDDEKNKMTKPQRNMYAVSPENKKPNALDMGFPKLKAECIKNAALSLGKVFGRDINRKHVDTYKPEYPPIPDEKITVALQLIGDGLYKPEYLVKIYEAIGTLSIEQREKLMNSKQKTLGQAIKEKV